MNADGQGRTPWQRVERAFSHPIAVLGMGVLSLAILVSAGLLQLLQPARMQDFIDVGDPRVMALVLGFCGAVFSARHIQEAERSGRRPPPAARLGGRLGAVAALISSIWLVVSFVSYLIGLI